MKTMHHISNTLVKKLLFLPVLCLLSLNLPAQTIQVRLDTVTAYPGDSITVPLYVKNFLNVGSSTFFIQFDNSVLTWGRILNWHPQLVNGVHVANVAGSTLGIVWADVAGANIADDKFADLKFKYLGGNSTLVFTAACEITDLWGNAVNPPPLYFNGLAVRKLDVVAQANPLELCVGASSQLSASAFGGFGNINYNWTSDPPGLNTPLINPLVYPSVTTTYTVRAVDDIDTAYSSVIVTAFFFVPPSVPENLQPPDGTTGLSYPILLSWSPCANTTLYDLYVWKQGDPEPTVPFAGNLNQISQIISSGLQYGQTYLWKVAAKNPCMQTFSQVQNFAVRHLPDLTIHNVQLPPNAFSGQTISATFQVKNSGLGSTLSSSWLDYAYLSTDTTLEPDVDHFIGSYGNMTALEPQESYQKSIDFTLPQGISGYFFLIVVANGNQNLPETNTYNNTGHNHDTMLVSLSPTPDLRLTKIIIPNSTFSGQNINITWKVTNYGFASTQPATWHDRLYFSTDTLLTASATNMGTFQHNGVLAPDSSYEVVKSITIPNYVFGRYYFFVSTDIYNNIYEHALENNNSMRSDSLRVFLTPPPDLVATNINVQGTASGNETIPVSWTVYNEGANPAQGGWTDKIYMSTSASLNTSTATLLGSLYHGQALDAGDYYYGSLNVTIPGHFNGQYYVFIFSDATNKVFEFDQEENNIKRSNPVQVMSPNLVVRNITPPVSANSGQTIHIDYDVMNMGPGKVTGSWVDRIFLSKKPTFLLDSCTALGSVTMSNKVIDAGDSIPGSFSGALPHGISGNYYIYIATDYYNAVFESTHENDNKSRCAASFPVYLSPWPDLTVTDVSLSEDTVTAGFTIQLSYTIRNIGPATARPVWRERFGISQNAFSTSGMHVLQEYNVTDSIMSDSAIQKTFTVTLPDWLSSDFYYFYILDDIGNVLYEYTGENNNTKRSDPVFILPYPPVDISVSSMDGPDAGITGQSITFTWSTKNLSGVPTASSSWYDLLFISTDTLWDPSADIVLGTSVHYGKLNPGESYTMTRDYIIPNGLSGNYYLIMVTDRNNYNHDVSFPNNIGLERDGNNLPVTINIQLTPPPDLRVTYFQTPGQVTSGQPFKIEWTVKNYGPGTTIPTAWLDRIYQSTDFILDGSDNYLGGKSHNTELAAGEQYTDSLEIFLPVASSGNYILIMKTDANNNVFEHMQENNNTKARAVFASQPPPSDLVVRNIIPPQEIIAGENATIQWTIKNTGANPATGHMTDIVYFSRDTVWDIGDITFGTVASNINLGAGASFSRSVTAILTGVAMGEWYIIVKTDVLNNINEGNNANNTGHSDVPTHVTVPELPMDVWTDATLFNNTAVYYRIEIAPEMNGETMWVRLKGDSVFGSNEMYLRFGNTPSRSEYDFSYSTASYGNQEILVPSLQEGTYYLLLYGSSSNANAQAIQLHAKILDFEILAITANTGGNKGKITVMVTGSKFTPSMMLYLQAGENRIFGQDLQFINTSKVYVTFDLNGKAPGIYNVAADKNCNGLAILENGFEIIPGLSPDLQVNVYQPSSARPGGISVIQVEFANAGNTDLVAPNLVLKSEDHAPVAFTVEGLSQGNTNLLLELREPNGPPGILRPGVSGTLIIYAKATKGLAFTIILPNY